MKFCPVQKNRKVCFPRKFVSISGNFDLYIDWHLCCCPLFQCYWANLALFVPNNPPFWQFFFNDRWPPILAGSVFSLDYSNFPTSCNKNSILGISFSTAVFLFHSNFPVWQILHQMVPTRSSVARAFPGGRVAHPEGQIEEENEKILRKNESNLLNIEEKWGKWKSCPPGTHVYFLGTGRLATALPTRVGFLPQAQWLQFGTEWPPF